jgi:hypothetical protein
VANALQHHQTLHSGNCVHPGHAVEAVLDALCRFIHYARQGTVQVLRGIVLSEQAAKLADLTVAQLRRSQPVSASGSAQHAAATGRGCAGRGRRRR